MNDFYCHRAPFGKKNFLLKNSGWWSEMSGRFISGISSYGKDLSTLYVKVDEGLSVREGFGMNGISERLFIQRGKI